MDKKIMSLIAIGIISVIMIDSIQSYEYEDDFPDNLISYSSLMCYLINTQCHIVSGNGSTNITNIYNYTYLLNDKWINGSNSIYPNSSYSDNVNVTGNLTGDNYATFAKNVSAEEFKGKVSCTQIYNGSDSNFCADDSGDEFTETDPNWYSNYTNGYNKTAWDEAYGWGDHAIAGYLTGESDPLWSGNSSLVSMKITQINLTETAYNASLVNGSLIGYEAGHMICNLTFSGSHLCNEFEVSENPTLAKQMGNDDAWIIAGSPKYAPATLPVNDCFGFRHGSAGTYLGNYWKFNSTNGGYGACINCGTTIKLACCK